MKKRLNFSPNLSLILGISLLFVLLLPSASDPQSSDAIDSQSEIRNPQMIPGQTATLLPDGRWLLVGGEGPDSPLARALIWDPQTKKTMGVSEELLYPRAYHTATVLPDGNVLILGGIGSTGQWTTRPELFNPERQRFETLYETKLIPRAYHTATLLTDGRVLIAGGLSEKGGLVSEVQLWDPRTNAAETLKEKLSTGRHSHAATLLADGAVLLWGGAGEDGVVLNNGELFDPINQQFTIVDCGIGIAVCEGESEIPNDGIRIPYLASSLPVDGAKDVPLETIIALRFSEPLRVETLNPSTVILALHSAIRNSPSVRVVPAEGGMLAFITPTSPLHAGTIYTLTLSGPTNQTGFSLPDTSLTFTTVKQKTDDPVVEQAADGEEWIPGVKHLRGDWKAHRRESPWQSLPPLQAEPGVTALAGQVLKLNGEPLANVTLQVEDQTTRTDVTGRFLLTFIPPGQRALVIDGRTANQPGKTYGLFEAGITVAEGQTNVLSYTIWMPVIDTAHAVRIPSPTTSEVVVTTPRIPGLEVRIPPKTVIRDRSGQVVTSISITPIPVDRTPFPLPVGVEVPIYFTIQPGGAHLETFSDGAPHGARVIYPNYTNLPPDARGNFWNYEPTGEGWYVYGQGTVSASGKQVVPDSGVAIYKFTGTMFSTGGTPPPDGPPKGNDDDDDGDPVNLSTGLFVLQKTDLILPDILPVALTRTYRQRDSVSRPFGIGMTHPYEIFLYPVLNPCQEIDLILPDGGRIHYVRISPGTGCLDAVFEHTATPTAYFKSQIKWNGKGWDLILKDGSVYVFGDAAPLQSMRDRYGNRITLTRTNGQTGNITRITSPNGRWIDFTYDASNRITQVKDNIGRVVSYTYDLSGRLSTVTDPNGGMTEYTYNTSHQMLTIKDAKGITFLTNTYDASGRVIKQTQADLTTYQFVYTLDANGKIIQTDVTDPRGNVRRVTFNSSGYVLTNTRAVGTPVQQTITYERQAGTNLVISVTGPLGRKTAYIYDSFGNRTSITYLSETLEAVTTRFTYEPKFHFLASITDPLNHTTTYTYDSNGNLSTVTDPLGNRTTLAYDFTGQLASITNPFGNTTQFGYELGDLTNITDPLGNNTTRFYDNAGRLFNIANPLVHLTRYEYDTLNHVTRITDPLGGIASFSYDLNGNLLSVTDARNNVTSYTYDNMDRLATRQDPLRLSESYLYDPNGNLSKFMDRKGQVTDFTYDALDRRTGVTYADLSSTTYTYDAGNRLTQVGDSISGTITRTYDNLDRLTSETTPQGTVSYTYDAAGRRTSMTVAGQPTVNYNYDNANRLTQITQGTSTVTFAYDAASRRTSLTFPNGVVAESTYDAASRLTGIAYKKGPTVLGNLTYTYDAAGNRTKISGSLARTRLPEAVSSVIYNKANQLTRWDRADLTYDANGNLTSDGTTTYTWDARNRLVSLSATGMSATFQYDPLGRRVNKTINGTSTRFLYDGQNPVQELSGTTPTANLLTGLRIDEFLTRTDSAETRSLLTDALGSTLALVDNTGTILTEYTYDPFGRTTVTGTANTNPFQYTGRENDGTGMYYYRARYYSPFMQRFISEDPKPCIRRSERNLYAYVDNNVINFRDSLGLDKDPPCPPGGCAGQFFKCLANIEPSIPLVLGCIEGCARICTGVFGLPPAGAAVCAACAASCAGGIAFEYTICVLEDRDCPKRCQ